MYWQLIAFAVLAVAIGFLWWRDKLLADSLRREFYESRKYDRDEASRLEERYWNLSYELETGMMELGLERRPGRPASSPTWVKPRKGSPAEE